MEQAVKLRGSRVNSRDNVSPAQAESSYISYDFYEAEITNLFVPWLIEEVPDGAWQTLQAKLDQTVRNIVSGKKG